MAMNLIVLRLASVVSIHVSFVNVFPQRGNFLPNHKAQMKLSEKEKLENFCSSLFVLLSFFGYD
jgi:hypothetical protein